MSDGLPSNTVLSIFKDSRGILWLGTDAGVVNYDGVDFRGFPLQDGIAGEKITNIIEDRKGNLWFASQGVGLVRFDGKSFERTDLEICGLTNQIRILRFFPEFDCLFVATSNGFGISGPKGLQAFSPLKGNLKGRLIVENAIAGMKSIELYSTTGNVYALDPKEYRLKKINKATARGDVPKGKVPGKLIAQTNVYNGSVWLIAENVQNQKGQLYRYHEKNFTLHSWNDQLSSYDLECLYYDPVENFLWLGSRNSGLIQIPRSPFTYFEARNWCVEGDEIVDVLAIENGRTILAYTSCIAMIDRKGELLRVDKNRFIRTFRRSGQTLHKSPFRIYSLGNAGTDKVWVASSWGFFLLDKWYLTLNYRGIQPAEKFLFDKHNQLICKWQNRVQVYGGSDYNQLISTYELGDQNSIKVSKVIARNGAIWIASRGEGLMRLAGDSIQVFNRHNSNIHNVINDITFDYQGNLIAGGNNGILYCLSFENGALRIRKTLDQSKGLMGTSIHGFQPEGFRHLWIGTNLGVHRLDLECWMQDSLPNLQFWDEKEGYLDRAGINSSLDRRGNIWVQTPTSLLRINTELATPNRDPKPVVRIREFKANRRLLKNKEVEINPWTGVPLGPPILDYSQNTVSFRFGIQNFLNPEKNLFRYKLMGFDKEWSDWSTSDRVVYSNLPGGKYVLEVQGRNRNKGGAESARFDFTVLPPWWATWWFYMILVLLLLGILAMGFYAWGCFVRRKEKARNKLFKRVVRLKIRALQAQLDPHFTFNALNSIQSYILEENTELAVDYLSDFSVILRKNFDNATREVIPLAEELSYLRSYIKLERMRFPDKFHFSLDVDQKLNIDDVKLPPMLIQPFLENAIKYGLSGKEGIGRLNVAFVLDSTNYLHCFIEDDGIGRNKARNIENGRQINSNGKALQLTRDRIKLLNHTLKDERPYLLEIRDLYDSKKQAKGTRVAIGIPLKN